jgi:choline-sulfatase
MSKPNILLIMADQLAAPALPMYGHKVVKTPNLERLASQGTTFQNAYCNNPVCAPSRFSMMTGQLSSRIGAYDNAAEFSSAHPTFAHYLRTLGYKTCLSGKMHFVGADQLHGFEERVTTDIYPSDFGWTPDWTQKDYPYAPSVMSMRGVVEAGLCQRSMQLDFDEEVTFHANRWLYDHVRSDDDRPFMLTASYTHPHNPFTITEEYWNRYEHEDIDMPSVAHMPVEERDAWSQRYFYLIRQDEHKLTDGMIRVARHAYYAMISYVDDQVGKLLDTLDKTGLAENTIVIFTADHGDMMGERGMWYKFNPFEWSVRVPLIARVPEGAQGRIENKGVSLLDLLPTFLDAATNGNPPELIDPVDGKSLLKMCHGEDDSRIDDVMMEYTGEGVYSPCFMLRQDGFKYVHCDDDPPMIFNLNEDPKELVNLAGNPEYANVEARMATEIQKRWDSATLKEKIIESQRRRHFVQKSLITGKHTPWDYQPTTDASRQYVRSAGNTSTTLTKGLARYPYVEPIPADVARES